MFVGFLTGIFFSGTIYIEAKSSGSILILYIKAIPNEIIYPSQIVKKLHFSERALYNWRVFAIDI